MLSSRVFRATSSAVLPVVALLLSGCATPENRVRNGLIDAGVSRPMATCMAGRMVDRLSLLQLRRIGRLGDLQGSDPRTLTVDQLLRRTRALGDPEILTVVSSSAAICAINGAGR